MGRQRTYLQIMESYPSDPTIREFWEIPNPGHHDRACTHYGTHEHRSLRHAYHHLETKTERRMDYGQLQEILQ